MGGESDFGTFRAADASQDDNRRDVLYTPFCEILPGLPADPFQRQHERIFMGDSSRTRRAMVLGCLWHPSVRRVRYPEAAKSDRDDLGGKTCRLDKEKRHDKNNHYLSRRNARVLRFCLYCGIFVYFFGWLSSAS